MPHTPLPLFEEPVRGERADAAANRERILSAAEVLFNGPAGAQVTMADIAAASGVGRATLYRRFPSVSAVAAALLDRRERELQKRLLSGAPPLGPGGAPHERLAAFYDALVDILEVHAVLVLVSETGDRRFHTGAYRFWRAHVRVLLVAAGMQEPDPLAEVLLAPLDPALFIHLRQQGEVAGLRIALARMARSILPAPE